MMKNMEKVSSNLNAIVSVSNKVGLETLVPFLAQKGYTIYSTGGTYTKILEILKSIENITIEEDIIEFSKIKISDRIKLIEQLPLSMYNEISEYIESVNRYLNEILTIDDIIVSIDTQFFDTSDID